MPAQTLPKTIRFLCGEHPSLRMIRRSQGEVILPNGNVAADPSRTEVAYQFDGGVLELREGTDMLADGLDPDTGEVVERDAVSWLRDTPEFGALVFEVEPMAPPVADALKAVVKAAAAGDVDELVRLGDEEADTWNRPEVLEQVRQAVKTIREQG